MAMLRLRAFATLTVVGFLAWGATPAPASSLTLMVQAQEDGGPGSEGPEEYGEVITEEAVTQAGLFDVHRVGEELYFEVPSGQLQRPMLLMGRREASSLQDPGGFFAGGADIVVHWERHGNRVVLRHLDYEITADTADAIWGQVRHFRNGPVLASFDVEAFGPDSAAVIDVGELFISDVPELEPIDGIATNRSWVENTWAFPENVNVKVTQVGRSRGNGGGGGPFGGGGDDGGSQSASVLFSMVVLPSDPMMPRWADDRVGFISSETWDFSRPENRAEEVEFIHRFRLEKEDPDAELSDPVEPIVYWIDPATPEWLKPWVKIGVDRWQGAFEEAGFTNAIEGRFAPTPEEDPDFSLFDARHSVIYWRPSTVPNATGGQIVDPRTGEILKGEVNMYHNVMDLLKNWYFVQVAPLDERAREMPLPDSLMGRLVEYVVTHEIGHSIGFPHNMKASAMYPVDSLRSATFLERMGGHVATLMDYSRFNYVAQPEDSIPPHLLVPRVGPYDRFAVRWGYRPIPEATTPDEERATLDEWAREQDEFPWLRFSTPDAEGDPENLTEAVGDEDAVRSTTLGMRNLDRVTDLLLEVAEEPGESYDELETLYGQTVAQWGRYMGHVASIVGGAYTQERYGRGARFDPLERSRQEEAVAYLNETAFHVPEMFLDRDVLRRIENEGVLERFRNQQARVLNALLSQDRLQRLVEFEALADDPAGVYTVPDLMEDLRAGLWEELEGSSVAVNAYRRNVQRAFLRRADELLHPSEEALERNFNPAQEPWSTDVRGVLRAELEDIDAMADEALPRAADGMTRIHLRDVRREIARILETD